ncbi:hypothetical protein Droror1_Dr00015065 [Drosera rotundifolia]
MPKSLFPLLLPPNLASAAASAASSRRQPSLSLCFLLSPPPPNPKSVKGEKDAIKSLIQPVETAERLLWCAAVFMGERLQQDLGTLIDEERHMKDDISSIMLRHTVLKDEKVKVAEALDAAKKVQEELQSLLSKKGQFELEEKVLFPML